MSRQYYIDYDYNALPNDVAEDLLDEINDLLESKGIVIQSFTAEDTKGFDHRLDLEIYEKPKTPKIPTPQNPVDLDAYFDACLRHWTKKK